MEYKKRKVKVVPLWDCEGCIFFNPNPNLIVNCHEAEADQFEDENDLETCSITDNHYEYE